jgi:hypothetical protein
MLMLALCHCTLISLVPIFVLHHLLIVFELIHAYEGICCATQKLFDLFNFTMVRN